MPRIGRCQNSRHPWSDQRQEIYQRPDIYFETFGGNSCDESDFGSCLFAAGYGAPFNRTSWLSFYVLYDALVRCRAIESKLTLEISEMSLLTTDDSDTENED